jgi:hypothetical protein
MTRLDAYKKIDRVVAASAAAEIIIVYHSHGMNNSSLSKTNNLSGK